MVREGNEDAYLVAPDIGLYAVADGMGGHAAGEVASRMTIDGVRAMFQDPDITWPKGMSQPSTIPGLPLLVAGVERANARVHATATADGSKAGMGTTFTGLLLLGDRAAIAHVGDSRAYLLHGRRLDLLTHDHTLVEEFFRAGGMSREAAARSTMRHVLTRAVGTRPTVVVDRRLVAIEPGDTLLLASDGLHGVVDDDEIADILLSDHDLTRVATRLVECANDKGGPDNTTVVLVRIATPG